MPILVTCTCKNTFRAPDDAKGKEASCPACGKPVKVEGPTVSPFDVFISYSSKDKTIADAAVAVLESRGLRCWVAPRDIVPGKEWSESIIEGLNQCRMMVLIFSANSNSSQQVVREVERAVNRNLPIVPFRIENLMPSKAMEYFISHQHWLDAYQPPLDEHLEKLASTCQSLLAGRGDQPAEKPKGLKGLVQAATRTLLARDNRVRVMIGLVAAVIVIGLIILGAVYMMKDPKAPDDVVKAKADAEALVEELKKLDRGQGMAARVQDVDVELKSAQGYFDQKDFVRARASFKSVIERGAALRQADKERQDARTAFAEVRRRREAAQHAKDFIGELWRNLEAEFASAQASFDKGEFTAARNAWTELQPRYESAEREALPRAKAIAFFTGYHARYLWYSKWIDEERARRKQFTVGKPLLEIPLPLLNSVDAEQFIRKKPAEVFPKEAALFEATIQTDSKTCLGRIQNDIPNAIRKNYGLELHDAYMFGSELCLLEGHLAALADPKVQMGINWRVDHFELFPSAISWAKNSGARPDFIAGLSEIAPILDELRNFRGVGRAQPFFARMNAVVQKVVAQHVHALDATTQFFAQQPPDVPLAPEQASAIRRLRELRIAHYLDMTKQPAVLVEVRVRKNLQPFELEALAALLAQAPTLHTLWLADTNADNSALKHLAKLPALEELTVSRSKVTEEGLIALRDLKSLKKLYLNGLSIRDPCLLYLAGLTQLRELSLNGTQITDAGLMRLAELKELKRLEVSGTAVTADGEKKLKDAIPGVTVVR